ncbi:MAG TPA: PIN domain-containing protein [Nanoarchaeota archaeon]|nr:PIN domain-containing protein [Nanoarchaeota archaeon]
MKIVIDTNFWIYAVLYKIRIFEELLGYEIYTLDKVLQELKQISKKKTKQAIASKIALGMIEKFNVKIINAPKSADEKLVELATQGFIIATNDAELVKKIKNLGGKVAQIRQKKYIEFL